MNWFYREKEIASLDDLRKLNLDPYSLYGFIYKLHLKDKEGKTFYYIGKKQFFTLRTVASRISKLPREGHVQFVRKIKNHKRKEYEIIKKEMDWLNYESSSDDVKDYIIEKKEIIDFSPSKRYLTYLEAKWLFLENAIEDDTYVNKNILGSFFRGNLEDPKIDYNNRDLASGGVELPPME